MTGEAGFLGVLQPMIVGDRRIDAAAAGVIEVRDPATDALVATVPRGGAEEARAAIDAAELALPAWRRRPVEERRDRLYALAHLVLRDRQRLAHLLTAEQGKPIREALGEITTASRYLRDAADDAMRVAGEILPQPSAGRQAWIIRQAVGVVGAVTPWNFPSVIAARKVAPAIAVGCTVVLKPASLTPLSSLALGELALEAGLPPGVLNVVTGDAAPIVETLLSDPRVRMLSFTGSTEVGRRLMGLAVTNITKLALELGGLAPFIVFDDADLDAAIQGLLASKFRNGGQTCICPNHLLVQAAIAPRFLKTLAEAMGRLRVGAGSLEETEIGPLIDGRGLAKVERHVGDALARGARLLAGGSRCARKPGLADRFYEPTLLADVDPAADILQEETFGPVVPARVFESEEQAIRLANDTPYGLAAYYYTRDMGRTLRLAEALEFGIIGANDGAPSRPGVPLGGMKASGIGREGGRWGIEEYLETKYVAVGAP